jgi:hypothetical protein
LHIADQVSQLGDAGRDMFTAMAEHWDGTTSELADTRADVLAQPAAR